MSSTDFTKYHEVLLDPHSTQNINPNWVIRNKVKLYYYDFWYKSQTFSMHYLLYLLSEKHYLAGLFQGCEIVQTENSDPVLMVGNDIFSGIDYTGTLFVDTIEDEDRDYVGFIFSYQVSNFVTTKREEWRKIKIINKCTPAPRCGKLFILHFYIDIYYRITESSMPSCGRLLIGEKVGNKDYI